MASNVVIYSRISEDKHKDEAGVVRQEKHCRLLAAAKGWEVDRVYRDPSISALDETKVRPKFEQLVKAVEDGQVDKILVWHLDRLAVRMADLARIVEAGRDRNVEIASVHGVSIDLGDPTGVAVAQILSSIAEMERRHKGNRQKAANLHRAEQGRPAPWSRRPFGFTRTADQVSVVESEALEIRRAADRILAGETLASIVRDMNRRGVQTSTGGAWNIRGLSRVLLSPRTAGRVTYNGDDMGAVDGLAILDEDTADRVQAVLRDPRRRTTASTDVKYLLSGVALCGACGPDAGQTVYASPYKAKGREYLIYRCPTAHLGRRLDYVDEVVEDVVIARLARPDAADVFTPDQDIVGLQSEADELRRRRDSLAAILADGLLDADAVRQQARKLTDRIDTLSRRIEAALGTSPVAELATSDDVAATWAGLSIQAKREVIRTLMTVTILPSGKGARFNPEQVAITWRTS
jgi:site-specific DNA recombinase